MRQFLTPLKGYMDEMVKYLFLGAHNFLMDGNVIRVIDHDEAGIDYVGSQIVNNKGGTKLPSDIQMLYEETGRNTLESNLHPLC